MADKITTSLAQAKVLVMQGMAGFSPTVGVEPIEGGHRVSIMDKDGEKTFDVLDWDGESIADTVSRRLQDRLYLTGNSKHRLSFVDGVTRPAVEHIEIYHPLLTVYDGLRQMSICGDFVIADGVQVLNGHTVLLTGFPKPSGIWIIHDCLTWSGKASRTIDGQTVLTDAKLRTASAILTPDGELKYLSPDGYAPQAGSTIHIDSGMIPTIQFGGEYNFPEITASDIANAAAWVKSHRGQFSYSNAPEEKNDAAASGATDCSGLIYNAFFHGAGKRVPNYASVQAGFGRIVAYYPPGETLEADLLEEGDLVAYVRPSEGYAHHVTLALNGADNKAHLWHVNTSYADGETMGPQPVAGRYSVSGDPVTDGSYLRADARLILRWREHAQSLYERSGGAASKLAPMIEAAVTAYLDNHPVSVEESDPTVPAWAKQPTKPSYTASEVGALPADTPIPSVPQMATQADMSDWTQGKTVDASVLKGDLAYAWSAISSLGDEIGSKANISDIPKKTSDLTNDSGFQTAAQVQSAIAAIPDELPDTTSASANDFLCLNAQKQPIWKTVPAAESNSFGGGS